MGLDSSNHVIFRISRKIQKEQSLSKGLSSTYHIREINIWKCKECRLKATKISWSAGSWAELCFMELEANCPKRWFQKPDMQENSRFLSGRQGFKNKQINKQATLKQERAFLLLDSVRSERRKNTDIMGSAQMLYVNVFLKVDTDCFWD